MTHISPDNIVTTTHELRSSSPIRLPGNHFTLWTRGCASVDFEPFYNGGPFNARAAYAWHHGPAGRREIAFTMYRDGGLYISFGELHNSYDPS